MTPSSSRGLISNSTKTIKKARPAPANQDSDTKAKKYKTFEDSKKQKILNDLWKGAIQILKQDPNQVSSDLLELLGGISLDQYNVLLRKTLTIHVDDFTYSVKALTQWRKKVKSWIQNQGKPETRGGLVVSVDRNELFRGRVIDILGKLPYRCFPTLQKSIIEVLEEFHNEAQDPANPKPFNPKTGSKHWWFNFIRKDADIKEMWEDLPLERTVKKNQRNSSSNSNSALMSDANSPVAEEEGNLNLNYTPVSGTVSTAGDSLEVSPQSLSPIRGESYQGLDLDNFYYGMEEEKIPESPSRYFAPQNNWREPESLLELDEVVIDRFPEQTHSPNQEDVEEDTFYSFLNRRLH